MVVPVARTEHLPAVDSEAAEIRIIALQPHEGSTDSTIAGTYLVKSLNDPDISYEALSYVWGTEIKHPDAILLDGREVSVTSSLFNALHRLRLEKDVRYLWVDAVCINQDDDEEKTKQVNMMDRVYSSCSQCDIWLGLLGDIELEFAQGAVEMITCVAEEGKPPSWFGNTTRHSHVKNAIRDIMSRPWWSRIWTVQEAVLPSHAVIYYGLCELPWKTLDQASENLMDHYVPFKVRQIMPSKEITDAMRGLRSFQTDNPALFLRRWRVRWATDPRDKVYGLGALRGWQDWKGVSCDYTIDVRTLYTKVMENLIRASEDLFPLIGMRNEERVVEGLPSWVVDWTRPTDPRKWRENFWQYYAYYERSRGDWHYEADKGVPGIHNGDELQRYDFWTLLLNGRFVDKVAVVESREDIAGKIDGSSLEAVVVLGSQRWRKMISSYEALFPSTPTKTDTMLLKLWQLVAGRFLPERPHLGEDRIKWVNEIVNNEPLFVTESGLIGFGQWGTTPGHELWIVGGSAWPFILERVTDPSTPDDMDFKFVGECIVPTIMSGEAPGANVEFRLR